MAGETVVKWSKETGYGAADGVTVDFRNSNTYQNIAAEIASSGGGGSSVKTNTGGKIITNATATANGAVNNASSFLSDTAGKLGVSTSIMWLLVGVVTVGLLFKK